MIRLIGLIAIVAILANHPEKVKRCVDMCSYGSKACWRVYKGALKDIDYLYAQFPTPKVEKAGSTDFPAL